MGGLVMGGCSDGKDGAVMGIWCSDGREGRE